MSSDESWNEFHYTSNEGRYHHWLPNDLKKLLPGPLPEGGELPEYYTEFDTLIHVTTLESANGILRDGFKPKPIVDYSVVSQKCPLLDPERNNLQTRPHHPVYGVNVIWYGPYMKEKLRDPDSYMEKYGNVVFSMYRLDGFEGIIRSDLKFYFIEVIEFITSSACRILVSTRDFPSLKKLEPLELGGPLYVQKEEDTNRLFYINRLKRHDGNVRKNTLEIIQEEMLGEPGNFSHKEHFKNHFVTFKHCLFPKQNVEKLVVQRPLEENMISFLLPNILKVAITMATVRNQNKVFLLLPFDNEETGNEKLLNELKKVHREAMIRYEDLMKERKVDTKSLIVNAFQGILHMSKKDIVDSYLEMF